MADKNKETATDWQMPFQNNLPIKVTSLPRIIKGLRQKHKLSLEQLASLASASGASHIHRIENGEIMPDLQTLENIFDQLHLKITVSYDKRYLENENQ